MQLWVNVASLRPEAQALTSATTRPLLPFCLAMGDPHQQFPRHSGVTFLNLQVFFM